MSLSDLSSNRPGGLALPGLLAGLVLALAGCAAPPAADTSASTAAPAPPPPAAAAPAPAPILPFEQAVLSAANTLLGRAQLPPDSRHDVVIDPLIDGMTGAQTVATQAMGARLVKLIKDSYPRYTVQPFKPPTCSRGRWC
jgi:hypothetical protein